MAEGFRDCPYQEEIENKLLPAMKLNVEAMDRNTAEMRLMRSELIAAATNRGYMPVKTHLLLMLATIVMLGVPLLLIVSNNEKAAGVVRSAMAEARK